MNWSRISSILIVSALLVAAASAAPLDPENYDIHDGGRGDIPHGAIVEGSLSHGGMQPDYIIDTDSRELQRLLKFARGIGRSKDTYWSKVGKILDYVRKKLPRKSYWDPAYEQLTYDHAVEGKDVPLSRYIACGAGVCRENALLTHLALKEAGIPNEHAYVKEVQTFQKESEEGETELVEKEEDHAFTIVEHDGEKWIVDPYNAGFNGYRLKDLMRPEGPSPESPIAPVAKRLEYPRHIIRFNSFPRVWVRKPGAPQPLRPETPRNCFLSRLVNLISH